MIYPDIDDESDIFIFNIKDEHKSHFIEERLTDIYLGGSVGYVGGSVGSTCETDPKSNANNGLITKVWGGPMWIANHAITFGYPVEPTKEKMEDYRRYFLALGKVLPCSYCRESYEKYINSGDTALTDSDLKSRETLTKWFYGVHEAVNNKLGVEYGVSYEDVVARYESFRARCGSTDPSIQGCVTPLDYKAFSFKKLNRKDCPIIPLELASPFVKVAKLRGIHPDSFYFYRMAQQLDGDINSLKKFDVWDERNLVCQGIIQDMRERAVPSIEEKGEWKGTPTIEELKLMLFLSSNLNKKELREVIYNLMQNQLYFSSIDSISD